MLCDLHLNYLIECRMNHFNTQWGNLFVKFEGNLNHLDFVKETSTFSNTRFEFFLFFIFF
jgi:hypothetical protein